MENLCPHYEHQTLEWIDSGHRDCPLRVYPLIISMKKLQDNYFIILSY